MFFLSEDALCKSQREYGGKDALRGETTVKGDTLGPAAVRQRARRSYSSDFSRQQVAAPAEYRYPFRTTHRHITRERPTCWSVAKLGRAFQQTGRTTNTAGKAASCAPCRGHYHGQESNAQPIGQVVRRLRARGSETDGQATGSASSTSISRRQASHSLSAFASCRMSLIGPSATTRNVRSLVATGCKTDIPATRSWLHRQTTERRRDAVHLSLERSSSVAATHSLYAVNYANGGSQHNFP